MGKPKSKSQKQKGNWWGGTSGDSKLIEVYKGITHQKKLHRVPDFSGGRKTTKFAGGRSRKTMGLRSIWIDYGSTRFQ